MSFAPTSQAQFETLFDNLHHAVFLKDLDGRFVAVNRRFCDRLKKPAIAVLGKTDQDLFPDTLANKYRQDDLWVVENGIALEDVEHFKEADGSVSHVQVIKTPHLKDGEVIGVQGEFWVITDRIEAEKSAATNERRLADYLSNSDSPAWMLDDQLRIRIHNAAFAEFMGRREESLIDRSFPEVLERLGADNAPADDCQEVIDSGLKTKKLHVTADDRTFLINRFPCTGGDGHVWVGAHAIDITEQIRRSRSIADGESRLRLIADASGDAMWDHDIVNEHMWRNPAYYELFDACPDTDTNSEVWWLSTIHPKDRDELQGSFREALKDSSRNHWSGHYRILNNQLDYRFIAEFVHIARDVHGAPIRLVGSLRDLTAVHQEKEEELERQTKLREMQKLESLGVLAGGIAHDFNNLLTSILGNIDLARQDHEEDLNIDELLAEMEQSSLRAADLCQQMLAYSGKGRFMIRNVELSEFIQEMEGLLTISASKKATIRWNLAPDLPAISADPTQLQQVIMNLVINASESLEDETGTITVSTRITQATQADLDQSRIAHELAPGNYVLLEVSDNGCGMGEEALERIFEPFYTTKFTGRGLGLSAVLGIVRGHKGAISVTSTEGVGTRLRIYLPCVVGMATSTSDGDPPSTAEVELKGRILIIDDEPLVRATASRILERAGYQVDVAEDGRRGIDVFTENSKDTDLILLDLTMPEMDGVEACRGIRKLEPNVPVVVMSGYNEEEAVGRFDPPQPTAFVQKPFQPAALLSKVNQTLADSRI